MTINRCNGEDMKDATHKAFVAAVKAGKIPCVNLAQAQENFGLGYEVAADRIEKLEDALHDACSGLKYIRETHGDLYGVGFDRVEEKAAKALTQTKDSREVYT